MSRKRKLIKGVRDITAHANSLIPNFKNAISEDGMRLNLINGSQVSEPRLDDRAPFEVHVNSFHEIDPHVDVVGFGCIAEACGVSSRQALRLLPEGKIPGTKLYGRWYSCQSSCDFYREKK